MSEQLRPVPVENKRAITAYSVLIAASIIYTSYQLNKIYNNLNKLHQIDAEAAEFTPASPPPAQEQYCIMVLDPVTTRLFRDCIPYQVNSKPIFET